MILTKLFNSGLGKYTCKAAHPQAAWISQIDAIRGVSNSATMVIVFGRLFVLFGGSCNS